MARLVSPPGAKLSDRLEVDEIYYWMTEILDSPSAAQRELREMEQQHAWNRELLFSTPALSYGGSLGCKIQTTPSRSMADSVIDSVDEEQAIFRASLMCSATRLNLTRMIDVAPLSDREKEILKLRHLARMSFEEIAEKMHYRSKSGAFKYYKHAFTSFAMWGVDTEFYYPVF